MALSRRGWGWWLVLAAGAFVPGSARIALADDEPGEGGEPEPGEPPEPGTRPEPGEGGDGAEPEEPVDPKVKAKIDARIRKFIESFRRNIHSADVSILEIYLKEAGIRELLVEDPTNSAVLCVEAAGYLARVPKDDLEKAESVAGTFVEIASKGLAKHPADRHAKVAVAAAMTARVRVNRALGKPVDIEGWTKISDLLLEAYTGESPDSGAYAAKAVAWLREPVEESAEIRPAFVEKATKLLAVVPTIREGPTRDVAKAQVLFLRATALGPAKAKPDVDACLATLKPLVSGIQPRSDAYTLHNEVVAWGKIQKVATGADFLFRKPTIIHSGLGYLVPEGNRWEDRAQAGDAILTVIQADHRGRILRMIVGDEWRWTSNYIFDDGGKEVKIGGDNAKGLARKAFLDAKEKKFSSITGQKDLVKAPFGKNLAQAQMFEVTGLDAEGQHLRLRGYLFKSKEQQLTYQIDVYEYGEIRKTDPELDAFFDRMFERSKKDSKPLKK